MRYAILLMHAGVPIPQNKFAKGRVLIRPTRALAERLIAGTAALNASGAFNSKWAATFYSHPKVADLITALKRKNGLEDISALHADGSPKVLFAGHRLLRQRRSNPGRLTRLFKVLEREGFQAEPDLVLDLLKKPNDKFYQTQQSANMELIKAPDAWDIQTGSHAVNVCIIDTGMLCNNCDGSDGSVNTQCTPNDLTPNCRMLQVEDLLQAGFDGTEGHDGDSGSVAAFGDDLNLHLYRSYEGGYFKGKDGKPSSHGTMVASVLAATGNNQKGTSGIAWVASVYACAPLQGSFKAAKGASKAESYEIYASFFALCAEFCIATNAHIVQISMGLDNVPLLDVMFDAIKTLNDNHILVTVAAGNDGKELKQYANEDALKKPHGVILPQQPAAYNFLDNMIVVGSVKSDGKKPESYSNYGAGVGIYAPGNQVQITYQNSKSMSNPLAACSLCHII
jgi:hypothetical protein